MSRQSLAPEHTESIRTSDPDTAGAVDREVPTPEPATVDEEAAYFKGTTPPSYLPQIQRQVHEFALEQAKHNRRIAVVTSGGTTVPLENNTVRFIDNFSAGTRGATSAEVFLSQGYGVIFLHREFSLLPYSRRYSHHNVLDFLTLDDTGKVVARPEVQTQLQEDLKRYEEVTKKNQLLCVPFTTVTQYLYTLRLLGQELQHYGRQCMFYLAAAVSDFFLPNTRVSEHKIQSDGGTGKLVINLDPVPKFLRRLVSTWTSEAMIVSFKLETDESLLLKKCRGALNRYGHELVIGNLLQTRKSEVLFVTAKTEEKIRCDTCEPGEIEFIFVPRVISLHDAHLVDAASTPLQVHTPSDTMTPATSGST